MSVVKKWCWREASISQGWWKLLMVAWTLGHSHSEIVSAAADYMQHATALAFSTVHSATQTLTRNRYLCCGFFTFTGCPAFKLTLEDISDLKTAICVFNKIETFCVRDNMWTTVSIRNKITTFVTVPNNLKTFADVYGEITNSVTDCNNLKTPGFWLVTKSRIPLPFGTV